MRVQPTAAPAPVLARERVRGFVCTHALGNDGHDVCFGKFARHHGYAFGRRRGAGVIKFCGATQLLFGRAPTGSFAFKIHQSKNFRLPLCHSLPATLALFFFFFFSIARQRAFLHGTIPVERGEKSRGEEKSYRRGKRRSLRKSSAESAKLGSAQVTTRRRFCQFSTNWPTARSFARDRDGFSWRGQKVSTAKSSLADDRLESI